MGLAPECWKFPTEPNFTAELSTPEKKGGLLEILRDAGGDYDKPSGARLLLGGAYCVGLMHKTSWSAGTLPHARYFFRFFNVKGKIKKQNKINQLA